MLSAAGSPEDFADGFEFGKLAMGDIREINSPKGRIEMIPKLLSARWPATATTAVVICSVFATPSSVRAQTNSVNGSAFQSVSIQQSQPAAPGDTILIGPDSFRVRNYPLRTLAFAYDTQDAFVSGPAALDARYNVEAKAPGPFPSDSGYTTVDAARAMVRQMLAS
jgi:hypothetical protein